jgi:hypothetical protein
MWRVIWGTPDKPGMLLETKESYKKGKANPLGLEACGEHRDLVVFVYPRFIAFTASSVVNTACARNA